jgi:hypothetical protein
MTYMGDENSQSLIGSISLREFRWRKTSSIVFVGMTRMKRPIA